MVSQQKYHQIWLIFVGLLFFVPYTIAQKIVASSNLEPLKYEFTGLENYQSDPDLVHALAYANHKDVRNIAAEKSFDVSYQVVKNPTRGFESTIFICPKKERGDVWFYQFHFPQLVLPELRSVKLVMKNGDEFIYVKQALIADDDTTTIIKFRHQRFSSKWQVYVVASLWEPSFSTDDFIQIWHWMNDYQTVAYLVNEESKLKAPSNSMAAQLYKKRWLAIYQYIQERDFYTHLIHHLHQDPKNLAQRIDIRKYAINRELNELKKVTITDSMADMKKLAMAYMRPDMELAAIEKDHMGLYSGCSFLFNDSSVYAYQALNVYLGLQPADKRQEFELYYQKLNMEFIEKHIFEKNPQQALKQIDRFQSFMLQSEFLKQSAIFQHFKSRAVYDIYLAYIQVARQAIDAGQMEMAVNYLDRATSIQQQYPREIINDIYVEKELQKLVKKALERYQFLRESGDIHSADHVKKGIQGLLKRYGLNWQFSVLKNS